MSNKGGTCKLPNYFLKYFLPVYATVSVCLYTHGAYHTGEAVSDAVAVRIVSLQDVDDRVWEGVLADLDVFHSRLYKHWIFVVDVGDRDADVG